MSETASGLYRVVVLIAATGAFAVLWRGDQLTQQQFVLARKAAAQQARQILLAERTEEAEAAQHETALIVNDTSSTADRNAADVLEPVSVEFVRVELEIDVPDDIAPGRYHYVDESGHIETIRVHSGAIAAEERDVYVLERPDGSRSVFIRASAQDAPTAAAASSISR